MLKEATEESSFDYTIHSGKAQEEIDYKAVDVTVTFVAGSKSSSIPFVINRDDIDEDDETFIIVFSNSNNLDMNYYDQVTVSILYEDPTPVIGFTTISGQVVEGIGLYNIILDISSKSEKKIAITYEITGLTSLNQDYELLSPNLIIIDNDTAVIELDFLADRGFVPTPSILTLDLRNHL